MIFKWSFARFYFHFLIATFCFYLFSSQWLQKQSFWSEPGSQGGVCGSLAQWHTVVLHHLLAALSTAQGQGELPQFKKITLTDWLLDDRNDWLFILFVMSLWTPWGYIMII